MCPETGAGLMAGGPIWSGPLHDESWVTRAIAIASDGEKPFGGDGADSRIAGPRPRLAARARAESLLRAVSRELLDVPLFYNLRDMFATLGLKKHPRREQVRLWLVVLSCWPCGFCESLHKGGDVCMCVIR